MIRIRCYPLPSAIHQEVGSFQRSLADQHFVAEHQKVFRYLSIQEIKCRWFADHHRIRSPVCIARYLPTLFHQAELSHDGFGNAGTHGTRINDRIQLNETDFGFCQLLAAKQCLIASVHKTDFDSDFSHACTLHTASVLSTKGRQRLRMVAGVQRARAQLLHQRDEEARDTIA